MKNLEIDLKDKDLDVMGCYRLAKALKNDLMTIQPHFLNYRYIDKSVFTDNKHYHEKLQRRNEIIRRILYRIAFINKSKFIQLWSDASEEQYNPKIMKEALLKINNELLESFPKSLVITLKKSLLTGKEENVLKIKNIIDY